MNFENHKFKCIQCGKCCSSPNILITLTHWDIFQLSRFLRSAMKVSKYIMFYRVDGVQESILKRLVLPPVNITEGKVVIGLNKIRSKDCIFLQGKKCSIYNFRPLVCRSYPYTFSNTTQEGISCLFVQNALEKCPGIGKGNKPDITILKKYGEIILEIFNEFSRVVIEINRESITNPLSASELLTFLLVYEKSLQSRSNRKIRNEHLDEFFLKFSDVSFD